MKKPTFILGLILSFALVSCNNTTNEEENKNTDTEQVKQKVNNIDINQFSELKTSQEGNIVDVRTPEEWSEGSIKDAHKINFYADDFAAKIQHLDTKEPIYIYCKSGGRSAQAAKQINALGFAKVYNVVGGFDAWEKAGNPIVK